MIYINSQNGCWCQKDLAWHAGVLDTGEHDAWIWTCVTVPAQRLLAHEKGIYP